MHARPTRGFSRKRRGFTILETTIATLVSVMVTASIIDLMILSGKTIKSLYGPTRARSARMIALDQIRHRLTDGKTGSVVISDTAHRIQFNNPNLGPTVTSEFYFDTATNSLYYDDDTGSGASAQAIAKGPIDITFELQSAGTIVKITVKTEADLAYCDVDRQDGETAVFLRNA